ncbi:MAG: hypothetical protein HFJ57_07350 [Clostridia bacterium]|nr:hypothetical protein [Clostridia bacterium]
MQKRLSQTALKRTIRLSGETHSMKDTKPHKLMRVTLPQDLCPEKSDD